MDCTKYRKLISDYIDGEISSLEEESLFQHLDVCPQCSLEMKNISILSTSIHEAYNDKSSVNIDFSANIMTKIKMETGEIPVMNEIKEQRENKKKPFKLVKFLQPVSIAASIALVSSIIYFSMDSKTNTQIMAQKKQNADTENVEQLVMEHMDRAAVAVKYSDITYTASK
jgi:anti-sigma factor RsiW